VEKKYINTDKQKSRAEHIEAGYETEGEAGRRTSASSQYEGQRQERRLGQ